MALDAMASHAALPTAHGTTTAAQIGAEATGTASAAVATHVASSNPHTQYAATTALTAHTGSVSNPHATTKAQIGLGNVDNTSDASKPVSTAQQTALNLKANAASPVFSGLIAIPTTAPSIASAATIAPTASVVFISGVATIATITAPSPISAGGGQITLIPTGLFRTGITGNIALATVAVVNKALILTYNAATLKWYPSY